MPNDDLGQFPMPQTGGQSIPTPVPTTIPEPTTPPVPEFEETPDEIPSAVSSQPSLPTESAPPTPPEPVVEPFTPPTQIQELPPVLSQQPPASPPTPPPPPPAPIPATIPASASGSSFRTVIFIVLFLVAIGGLAGAAFLYQQTAQLRDQLADITQTLQQQKISPVVTPTPSVVEIPITSPTPQATSTATPTPSISVPGSPLMPLSVASSILKTAIDYQPNAQLILIKTDKANNSQEAITKYFFRQDLNTKKYFYILVSSSSNPEIIDKNIQVTPDNNIPSLNNLVLGNTMGIDLNEALQIAYSKCPNQELCLSGETKAQYIQTAIGAIWQVSLYTSEKTDPYVMQINAQTKQIIFRTADFNQD